MNCPNCFSNARIVVTALADVVLSFDGGGVLVGSEPVDGNHEWEDGSAARCLVCDYSGTAADFRDNDEPEEEEE